MFIRLVGKQDHHVNLSNVAHVQWCAKDPSDSGTGKRVIFHFIGGEALIMELPLHEADRLARALAGEPADPRGAPAGVSPAPPGHDGTTNAAVGGGAQSSE